MFLPALSLVFLVGAIILGFVRKLNVGWLCLGLAPILALIGGISINDVYAGFPGKMFVTLLGPMLLFALLQENGTLELVSRRVVALAGRRYFLIPIIIYLVSYCMSAAGPGALPVAPVMVLVGVTLAVEMDANPILVGGLAQIGATGGTTSPIALTGIIVKNLFMDQGITQDVFWMWIGCTIANVLCAIFVYILYKGYKLRGNLEQKKDLGTFNTKQFVSLIGMLAMIIAVIVFGQDVGLMSYMVAFILIVLQFADEKAVKNIPWAVLILVCGVNVLMSLAMKLGGIDLMADGLSKIMNGFLAPFVMAITGGFMSWFSSANGVVLPALVPAVPGIVEQIGGNTTIIELVIAITAGATVAGISPMSTGGSMVLSFYAAQKQIDDKQQRSIFIQLFGISAAAVAIVAVVGLFGLYRLG